MSDRESSDRFSAAKGKIPLSMGEGSTPLVRSMRIGRRMGVPELYFKLENLNPTGSYKDRFAAAAVRLILERGKAGCLCTSSGNAGAALSAYCARAGLPCLVLSVEGAAPDKLANMRAYGATVVEIAKFGTDPVVTRDIMDRTEAIANKFNLSREITAFLYAPDGMSAVTAISHEIKSQHESNIQHVFAPSGGGGLALAVARGFLNQSPSVAVHCVQPEGNDTIAGPLRAGMKKAVPCVSTTKISGLQVGAVIDGDQTLHACRSTGGTGFVVSDLEIFESQCLLAREEGIFAEPAGAAALAGFLRASQEGCFNAGDRVVCLVTGTGFKDMRPWMTNKPGDRKLHPPEDLEELCGRILSDD